jgi:hypothetical protein
VSAAAQAQVGTDIERAPTMTIERYNEDRSYLANPAAGPFVVGKCLQLAMELGVEFERNALTAVA